MSFADVLANCESALREGHGQRVQKLIAGLNLRLMTRELRLPFANVCRRAQLIALGLTCASLARFTFSSRASRIS